jgi:two-component system phosphate regulon response regulator PhoB
VWGDHVYIEERTVDVHVKRLREALGPAGSMVETVRGAGYRLTAKPLVPVTPVASPARPEESSA